MLEQRPSGLDEPAVLDSVKSQTDTECRTDVNVVRQNKPRPPYVDTEFTFHPRVSTASTKIVENLGMDFLERQKRHVERQKLFIDENRNVLPEEQTPKRLKVYTGFKQEVLKNRPNTSDRGLLKKRSKLMKNSVKRHVSDVLEPMNTNQIESPLNSVSPSPPSLLPRSKTYCSSISNSLATSGIYGSTTIKKRTISDPYANFDRLQKAKSIAEKAIKSKKIFSIHGPYPLIRKALRERGWVEKEFKLPIKMKSNNKPGGDSSDLDDDDYDDDDDDVNIKDSGFGTSPRPSFESSENDENDSSDCYGIMGRMVRNEVPVFQWTTRTSSVDWRLLQKDQIVNHFSKANFTTKVGLCMNLRMVSCFAEGHSDTFFPRCYRLSNEEDKHDFIDDFRLTAASGLLKIAISRHIEDRTGNDDEKIKNGQLPPKVGSHVIPEDVIMFAIKVCRMFGEEREHEDIDKDESILYISEDDWTRLIIYYSKLVHEGATLCNSGAYFKQCEEALNIIKDRNPQFLIEGCKNTWIIKPGAKSRGRGIVVMNRLDEILKLVSGDPNLMKDGRWVVQKYIERPLLVYGTKFDVRQWFLVSDWNPVTVWIYKESYLRFSSRPFNLKNLDPSIHLCNYSLQKHFENDPTRHPELPTDNMWSDTDFKNYLRSRGCHTLWGDKIFPGMKKAIVHICQTAQDVVEYRKGSFELYGADFMIDENYNPWLIEVNSSPTMSRSTLVTSKLCASVQEDTLKVILDRKKDKNCDIGLFELMYKQHMVDVPLYVGKALNVEGVPIKKPQVQVRRSLNNSLPFTNLSQASGRGDSSETLYSSAAKHLHRAASVYSQNVGNKTSRTNMRTNTSSGVQSQAAEKLLQNRSSTVKTPVKIKMQSTMKRLNNEVSNTPNKANAFNFSKSSKTASSQMTATNQNEAKSHATTNNFSKLRRNIYSVKGPNDESLKDQKNQNTPGHFVSSSQAKAVSTMGIMNFGTAYNSVVAAANRGCLNGKYFNPHPPPQLVVPKTFPTSALAGGAIVAGGNTMNHPPAPPGVVALSPQNIGLSLPFCKYYHPELSGRRGASYVTPDSRFGSSYVRVSGICEWLNKQQHESGLLVSSYYSSNENNDYTKTSSGLDAGEWNSQLTKSDLAVPTNVSESINPKTMNNLSGIDCVMQQKANYSSIHVAQSKIDSINKLDKHCPFVNELSPLKKISASSAKSLKKPKWEEFVANNTKTRRRRSYDSFVGRNSSKNRSSLPLLSLYSLSHRNTQNVTKNKRLGLTISCPSV